MRLDEPDYEAIFDNISEAIIVHPVDSADVLAANSRAVELFGYDREELLSMSITDLTADDWDPPNGADESVQRAREEENITFEWRNQRADGTPFWVEVNLSLVELQGTEHVLSSIRDISSRKEQERHARAIFDQTYQLTGLLEPDGTLIEANQTALDFGDLDRDDVIGKPLWECYWCLVSEATQRTVEESVERAATGEFVRTDLEIQGSHTTEIIDFSLRPVRDERGTVDLIIPEGRLITEQYERGQRLDVLDRILRHNLRNQLTVINGFADSIADSVADPEVRWLAEEIRGAGENLETVSDQIREFERLKRTDTSFEPVHVRTVVESVVADAAQTHPDAAVRTTFEDEAHAAVVVSNRPFLRLALSNLLDNAVEHGSPPIQLTVSHASDAANSVVLTVIDEGGDLTEQEFRPLVRESEAPLSHGSGIGLWIVKWSVDELGGDLSFETTGGQTAVTISLRETRTQV